MLKVTVSESAQASVLKLEGRLVGPWVREVENVWNSITNSDKGQQLAVDLCQVTFVDAAGKELLKRMHKAGASLDAAGPLVKYIVQTIQSGHDGR